MAQRQVPTTDSKVHASKLKQPHGRSSPARMLRRLGALDTDEAITPLGTHLARMPVDLRVGKMLLYGAMLGCVDPVLTIAAAMSLQRSPFLSPFEQRKEAERARAPFLTEMSDQLGLLRAYEGWSAALKGQGRGAARRFCEAHFLAAHGMEELHGMREQLAGSLGALGFAASSLQAQGGEAAAVRSTHKAGLVRAIVCAGLYPNVAEVRLPDTKYRSTAQGAIEAANEEARLVKYFVPGHGRVFIHPSSALFSATHFHKAPWLVYSSKQQTAKLFLRDVCLVGPMALLLFGGELSVQHEKQTIVIDGHITLAAPARVAVLVREMRTELQKLLARKIAEPAFDMNASSVLEVIIKLLSSDGAE